MPHCVGLTVLPCCTADNRGAISAILTSMCLVLSLQPLAAAAAPAQPSQGAPPADPDDGYGPPADPVAAEAMLLQVPGSISPAQRVLHSPDWSCHSCAGTAAHAPHDCTHIARLGAPLLNVMCWQSGALRL